MRHFDSERTLSIIERSKLIMLNGWAMFVNVEALRYDSGTTSVHFDRLTRRGTCPVQN